MDSGQGWCQRQRELDRKATAASESLLGLEKAVFGQTMEVAARCLLAVFSGGQIDDVATKRKIAVANHAFNMLWSAWEEALAGRYDAATDHWRSIDESPDYLMALQVNPCLAREMAHRHVKASTVRRTIRKALDDLKPGEGKKWLERRSHQGHLQQLAHVTAAGTQATLPIAGDSENATALVNPGGGVVSDAILRKVALYLADGALDLLNAIAFACQDVGKVKEIWEKEGRKLMEEGKAALARCAEELGLEV